MAKKQTDSSRYPSIYSPGGFVTEAQYIVETMCERRAKKLNRDLPIKFWNLPEWSKYYKWQITICNALLKKHEGKHIIQALKDDSGKYIFSLKAPWLKEIIEKYEKIKPATIETRKTSPTEGTPNTRRPKFGKSPLDILKELDSDERNKDK